MSFSKHQIDAKNSVTMAKIYGSSGTSNYSTCSESQNENINYKEKSLDMSLQSTILAGHILPDSQCISNNEISNEITYSVNLLDKNLDAFSEDDVFLDCNASNVPDSSESDSTKYMPIEPMSKLKLIPDNYYYKKFKQSNKLSNELNKKSDDIIVITSQSNTGNSENIPLITILEESEANHTNKGLIKNTSSTNVENNLNPKEMKIVNHIKDFDNDNNKKHSLKRVLFADDSNTYNMDQECIQASKEKFHDQQKILDPSGSKSVYLTKEKKDLDKNFNKCNERESYALWEKFWASDTFGSRKSMSLSELNSINVNYGDDEYSTSFETFDDISLHYKLQNFNKDITHKKYFKRRSKSCESLLKDVKHLPHILYERFLKCLANEIQHIRKQKVICTCISSKRKYLDKENMVKIAKQNIVSSRKSPSIKYVADVDLINKNRIFLKTTNKLLIIYVLSELSNSKLYALKRFFLSDSKNDPTLYHIKNKLSLNDSSIKLITKQASLCSEVLRKTSPQNIQRLSPISSSKKKNELYSLKDSPIMSITNQTNLSPDALKKTSPQNIQRLSPKSSAKKKNELYSWRKEIVSPVGEYIKGKRQSPFQNSPSKKKAYNYNS